MVAGGAGMRVPTHGTDRGLHGLKFPPVPKSRTHRFPCVSLSRFGTEREAGLIGLESCPQSDIKVVSYSIAQVK